MTGHARIVWGHVIVIPQVINQVSVSAGAGVRIGGVTIRMTIVLAEVINLARRTAGGRSLVGSGKSRGSGLGRHQTSE